MNEKSVDERFAEFQALSPGRKWLFVFALLARIVWHSIIYIPARIKADRVQARRQKHGVDL